MTLLASAAAHALNGNVYIGDCATCSTSASFVAIAKSRATVSGNAGTYLISSQYTARSAFVRVNGVRVFTCDSQGENCVPHLTNAVATAVRPDGSAITSESDLDRIDEITFAGSRNQPLAIKIDADYAASFINSLDEEVGPGIDRALDSKKNQLEYAAGGRPRVG